MKHNMAIWSTELHKTLIDVGVCATRTVQVSRSSHFVCRLSVTANVKQHPVAQLPYSTHQRIRTTNIYTNKFDVCAATVSSLYIDSAKCWTGDDRQMHFDYDEQQILQILIANWLARRKCTVYIHKKMTELSLSVLYLHSKYILNGLRSDNYYASSLRCIIKSLSRARAFNSMAFWNFHGCRQSQSLTRNCKMQHVACAVVLSFRPDPTQPLISHLGRLCVCVCVSRALDAGISISLHLRCNTNGSPQKVLKPNQPFIHPWMVWHGVTKCYCILKWNPFWHLLSWKKRSPSDLHTKSPLKVVSIVFVFRYFPSHTILRNALSSFIISLNSSLGGSTSTSHLFLFNCTIATPPPLHSHQMYAPRPLPSKSLTAHRAHIKLSKYYSLVAVAAQNYRNVLRERCIAHLLSHRDNGIEKWNWPHLISRAYKNGQRWSA